MDKPDSKTLARIENLELLVMRLTGAGGAIISAPWQSLAAGAQPIAAAGGKYLCSPAAGQGVAMTFVGNAPPPDGAILAFKDFTGGSQSQGPLLLSAPTAIAGWTVEEAQAQGTFGATSSMANQGGCWWYQVIAAQKKIVLIFTA